MRAKLSRWAPPGYPLGRALGPFAIVVLGAFLFSLGYVWRFLSAQSALYTGVGAARVLLADARMPDFRVLLGSALAGFALAAALALFFAWRFYAYHRQGARSDYLMRRLPERGALHRRCLTLPFLGVALCLLAALCLLLLYYWIYMSCTPEACLTPMQWQKLWRMP